MKLKLFIKISILLTKPRFLFHSKPLHFNFYFFATWNSRGTITKILADVVICITKTWNKIKLSLVLIYSFIENSKKSKQYNESKYYSSSHWYGNFCIVNWRHIILWKLTFERSKIFWFKSWLTVNFSRMRESCISASKSSWSSSVEIIVVSFIEL